MQTNVNRQQIKHTERQNKISENVHLSRWKQFDIVQGVMS